jgi:hypothetical protein
MKITHVRMTSWTFRRRRRRTGKKRKRERKGEKRRRRLSYKLAVI